MTQSRPAIVICDDDAQYASELAEALALRGYAAAAMPVLTGALVAGLSPAVLVLDLCMPQHDGIEILNLLAAHPRKRDFGIILVSGAATHVVGAAAMLCDVQGLRLLGALRKPLDVSRLCALLACASI